MKRKIVSFLLAALMVCAMLPMSAFAAETGKLAAVEFTPSDTLSDTFVAVTAAKGTQGETPVFTLDSGNSITVTAKNGALLQEVYLTDYVEASQGGSTTHAGLVVAARVALGVLVTEDPSAPPAAETPALSVSASEGQIAREDGFYSVKGINAGSVTVSATDAHSFSAITVAYSLDLTKQEIIDAINEKGTAFKAERETYKAAKSVFDEANKTFEPAKSPLNAYEQAKADWEKAESAHQELINRLDAAKSELQSAKDAYPTARDEYLALRARAQALGMTEAQGLPAEIKENEALAELFTAPDPSSLPVPLGTAERSFYASDVGTETEGITISARKMGNTISLNIGSPITMSNSVGEIKSVYMVRSPDSMGGGNLSLKGTPGTYYYNNNQNAQYSITNVNSPDLKIEMQANFVPGINSLFISEVIVKYTRPMIEDEVIAALGEKGPAYEAAQNAVLLALQAVNEAQKAVDESAARRSAAEANWNEAQAKWETEKPAYENAKAIFDAAEETFRQAEEKYFAVRDDYQGFYEAGKADLAALNREAGLAEDDGLPALITEEELDTASTLSQGSVWIICAVAAAAVIAVGAIVIGKKKRVRSEE